MTVLNCLRKGQDICRAWIAGLTVCSVSCVILFVASIIRARRSRPEHRFFDTPETKAMKVSIIVVLGLKGVAFLLAVIIGSITVKQTRAMNFAGAFLLEFPNFVASTSCSCALIAWITFVKGLVPIRFRNRLSATVKVLIGYNVVSYTAFLVGVIMLAVVPQNRANAPYWGVVFVVRDLSLALICLSFIILLRLGIGRDAFVNRSLQTPKFTKTVSFLAICLFLRGCIGFVQAMVYARPERECKPGFFAITMIDLLLIECVPLGWLMFFSFSYLSIDEDQTDANMDPNTLMAGLATDTCM